MGKYWVQGYWTNDKHEAHALAKRLGAAVWLTDGWLPTAQIGGWAA